MASTIQIDLLIVKYPLVTLVGRIMIEWCSVLITATTIHLDPLAFMRVRTTLGLGAFVIHKTRTYRLKSACRISFWLSYPIPAPIAITTIIIVIITITTTATPAIIINHDHHHHFQDASQRAGLGLVAQNCARRPKTML